MDYEVSLFTRVSKLTGTHKINSGTDDFLFTDNDYGINENPAGLVVSHHVDEEGDKDDEDSNVDWTGGFGDSFTTQPAADLHRTQSHNLSDEEEIKLKDEDEDEDDPFGDFSSSTSQPTDKWEDGFSSNFADMDVNATEEKNLKKETPASA